MTPEAQRIAIAEACGYLKHHPCKHCGNDCGWMAPAGAFVQFDGLPDYLSDLNAMHEAEKVLTEEQQFEFLRYLANVCFPISEGGVWPVDYSGEPNWLLVHATAAQRAEAFLCCMNLWDDTK